MKIGILGAGNIGGNLGRRFCEVGHEVKFGVRDPAKVTDLVAACGARASAGTAADAAAFGDCVVVALPWKATLDVLASAGDLRGKVLLDATNALTWDDGPMPALETSAAEVIAEKTGARVVKAFNTLGAEHILRPRLGELPCDLFLCTDDDEARRVASGLAEDIGFTVVDLGPLRYARTLEHIAIAWIDLAMKQGMGRNIAFKVLRG